MSCTVTLTVRAESTAWGETVGIAGSLPELSAWGATAPPPLTASPFPTWGITLTLPADTPVQYKYVILAASNIARWEVLPSGEENRSFTTPADGETLTIDDGCMGDATRTSATVTPSTTPTTTPTRPQKHPDLATDLTHSTHDTEPRPTEQSLADFTAQLENSRRQVEHVRAAVRRIRHIPTPDALPTPPGTPNQSTRLSHDAAAALASHTLSEAKADVDLIREKLRAVRSAKSKPAASSPNFVMLGVMVSFGVAIIATGVVLIDPETTVHIGSVVRTTGERVFEDASVARGKLIASWNIAWEAARCWGADARLKMETELHQAGQSVVRALARAKLGFVVDWLAELARVRKVVRQGVLEQVNGVVAKVNELRVGWW